MREKARLALLVVCGVTAACGVSTHYVAGTRVADTSENRAILELMERYRLAVERKDAAALLLMASPSYHEDGGTPSGTDDYGFEGLRDVLTGRFQHSFDIRYSLQYMGIRQRCPEGATRVGCRAFIEVLIDASYTVHDARGESIRRDMRDQNQLVLEYDGKVWRFIAGM